jgi:chromosomal replication initiator protein
VELVETLLREILYEEGVRSFTIKDIQKKVAEHFDLRLSDMTSKSRSENVALPRRIAMFLARSLTEASLTAIGEAFGGRDHGTVLHSCRVVKDRMEVDTNIRQVVTYLEKSIRR